ncbi:15-hydroxyprostaglandin dehydrogenase [NAD+] [Harpegnathos saltator]|uniref:15-hydroxyprostaglandin dehydrogenase [NAD+] n=1 Tax=Harpegnathos saltator TaxID=610380 RepID=E2BD14_HARSA|nr:15-hydroxyprostaglandin dehydrogenase [NAD+] [Harpegnathos saltator]
MDYTGKHKGGEGGLIVNISSILGLFSQNCMMPVYCVTKHAVVGFSEATANFYHDTGVRIVMLCPGLTLTPLVVDQPLENLLDFVKPKSCEKFLATYEPH